MSSLPASNKTATLALDYRPKKWSDLVGQPIPVTVLVNSLSLGEIKPGYIFDGTTGCGKSSAAYLFAKRLNCENPNLNTQDPCGQCHSCNTIDRGTNADVKFVDGAADRSIAFVRDTLKPFLMTVPKGKYKVAIIDEAHLYKSDAISAFLTLLENMPKHSGRSVVILTTTEGEAIDTAVMNRCVNLHFSPIPTELLATKMADYTSQDPAVLALLAEACGNSFRAMWSYIEVWELMGQPLTPELVMNMIGGVTDKERQELWADIAERKVETIAKRWKKWQEKGARISVVGSLLIKDLVRWAAANPDSTDWHKPLAILSGAQQVGAESAWLQSLYLLVGLPLDVQRWQWPEPGREQPQLLSINTEIPKQSEDNLLERILFFGG